MKAEDKKKAELTLVKPETRELSNEQTNFFASYGAQVSQKSIIGTLLKFNKGDWLYGEDNDEMEDGEQLIANMDQLLVGWIKWVDNKPAEQIMGLVSEGYQAPKRHTLGDTEEENWEVDDAGKARDPWQFSNYLVMKRPGKNGDIFTFATSSKGGLNAIGELCKSYGKDMRVHPDEYPTVEIGTHAYDHPKKEYGRIKIPTLKLVGWEKKSLFILDAPAEEPAKAKPRKR
jgi:hypothetical protein